MQLGYKNYEGNSSETGIEMHECWLGNLSERGGDADEMYWWSVAGM